MRMNVLVVGLMLSGCASSHPWTISAGFMGADISVSTPGWEAPVPVVQSPVITKPTLLVPSTSPAAGDLVASTPNGSVPVVVAPVATETLAIPVK